ncbi:hypothetical protein Pmani_036122 [Petrolisthes manimaculis]|uniref:Uncharacterized protein n=1 Tax=Petrolisthes manimaculis TaxID=1843537 RepID=A0AAE1NJ06_9EUCA|nr:hypothetical protein Pmani_036122 [Petrolisthes manimaculis]
MGGGEGRGGVHQVLRPKVLRTYIGRLQPWVPPSTGRAVDRLLGDPTLTFLLSPSMSSWNGCGDRRDWTVTDGE